MLNMNVYLKQLAAKSDNGKATRSQVNAALEIISGADWHFTLSHLGLDAESAKSIPRIQVLGLARIVLRSAIFGDDLLFDPFADDE